MARANLCFDIMALLMKTRLLALPALAILIILMLAAAGRAPLAHAQVQYATPTPLPDGRIIYIVQPGDTCIRISLLTGLSVEQIILLNRLDENCQLQEGQQLLLGVGASVNASPTPFFAISPTPSAPTPTPFKGLAEICVQVFDDANGDMLHQETEPAVLGAVVGIASANGQVNASQEIRLQAEGEFQGVCFADLPEGTYTISAAIPEEYNATTPLSYEIEALAGDRIFIGFGAQSRQLPPAVAEPEARSPLLGLIGGLLLFGGIVLFWYMRQMTPRTPYSLR